MIAVLVQRDREMRVEAQRAHWEAIGPVYEGLMARFTGDAGGLHEDEGAEPDKFFKDAQRKLLLYASSPVIREWVKLRINVSDEDSDDENLDGLMAFEDFVLAIRKELGHNNSALERGDTLRVYVNDVDAAVRAWIAQHPESSRA